MNDEIKKDNPFVTSEKFMELVTLVAKMSKVALGHTTNSGEGCNAILSLMVTFLKNIPDPLWKAMMDTASNQTPENPTLDMMRHLDAVRSYSGQHYMEFKVGKNPAFNAPIPTTTQ